MPPPSRTRLVLAAIVVGVTIAACGFESQAFVPSASESPPAPTAVVVRPLPSPVGEAGAAQQPDGTFRFEPVSARVVAGTLYTYTAFTHCGFTPTTFDFDGSFWQPAAAAPQGQGANPPAGIDNPEDAGTIALVGPNEAIFTSRGGIRVPLVRVEGPQEGFPCD